MGESSNIAWTHNTFNPWIGCTKVSPACDRCYAEDWAKTYRSKDVVWGKPGQRANLVKTSESTWRQPIKWNRAAEKAGERKRVFCASLADVFDTQANPEWRAQLWQLIFATPHLDWLLLTKRPQNMRDMVPWADGSERPWRNVWLGTTAENQEEYDRRKPLLMGVPAAVHFLSMEPLLGPIAQDDGPHPNWVIVGGESGSGFRTMGMGWVESIRAQCANRNIAFFFKQDSSTKSGCKGRASESLWRAKYFPQVADA